MKNVDLWRNLNQATVNEQWEKQEDRVEEGSRSSVASQSPELIFQRKIYINPEISRLLLKSENKISIYANSHKQTF